MFHILFYLRKILKLYPKIQNQYFSLLHPLLLKTKIDLCPIFCFINIQTLPKNPKLVFLSSTSSITLKKLFMSHILFYLRKILKLYQKIQNWYFSLLHQPLLLKTKIDLCPIFCFIYVKYPNFIQKSKIGTSLFYILYYLKKK